MGFKYIGDINNWMDLRDAMIERLEECDTELKFNLFLIGTIASLSGGNVNTINKTRKKLGIPELSKKELKSIEDLFAKSKNEVTDGSS